MSRSSRSRYASLLDFLHVMKSEGLELDTKITGVICTPAVFESFLDDLDLPGKVRDKSNLEGDYVYEGIRVVRS